MRNLAVPILILTDSVLLFLVKLGLIRQGLWVFFISVRMLYLWFNFTWRLLSSETKRYKMTY